MLENSLHASVDVVSREIRFMSVNPGFVEFDGSFQVMLFHIPKLISGVDISSKSAEVVYGFDPDKPDESYRYPMTLWAVDGDYCVFKWDIPFTFFAEKRWAYFQVRVRVMSGETVDSQWSTKLKKVYVTPGFTGGQEAYTQAQQDAIAALNSRVTALEASGGGSGGSQLQIDSYPEKDSLHLITSGGVWKAIDDIDVSGSGIDFMITQHPVDTTVDSTESVNFHVTAIGTGLAYQWQYRKNSSEAWKNFTNTTGHDTDTLTIAGLSGTTNRDGYEVRCQIMNSLGNTLISESARLTVILPMDARPTSGSPNYVTSGGVYAAIASSGGSGGGSGDVGGLVFNNPNNILRLPDLDSEYSGVTYRSRSDLQMIYLDGTLNSSGATVVINMLTGDTATSSSNAASKWGGESIPSITSGHHYKFIWRCVSGSYTTPSSTNGPQPPAISVRNSSGNAILSNKEDKTFTLLGSSASYAQLWIYRGTVFDQCWIEVSVIESDVEEYLWQSSASMKLNEGIEVPKLSSLIDETSYTIPAEVSQISSFEDSNGWAQGGCTNGVDTLYYVCLGSDGNGRFVKADRNGTITSYRVFAPTEQYNYIHCNGMCCSSDGTEILVIPLDKTGTNTVYFLSESDLSHSRKINFGDSLAEYAPGMSCFTGVAWDATKQLYVFLMTGVSPFENPSTGTASKKYRGFAFYDSEFNFVNATFFDRILDIPGYNDLGVEDTTFGGVYTDANYIYTTVHIDNSENIDDTSDFVAVFDWDGLFIGSFKAAFGNELEWMGRLNDGTWYFGYGGKNSSNRSSVFVYTAETSLEKQVLKDTVRSQFKFHSVGSGGSSITVDDALSSTSENPVQNKVIYQALQSSGGGSGSGWRQLTSEEFQFTAGSNISGNGIQNTFAYYNADLGLVRFSTMAYIQASTTASPDDLTAATIQFSGYYKPLFYAGTMIDGVVNASVPSYDDLAQAILEYYSSVYRIRILSAHAASATYAVRISGYYYTEDLPT